jgi:uncharacterized lipoprotein YajG
MTRTLSLAALTVLAACSTPPTQQQVTAGVQAARAALVCYKDGASVVALPGDWTVKADAAAVVAATDPACQAAVQAAVQAALAAAPAQK